MYHNRVAKTATLCPDNDDGTVIIRQTPPKLQWQICRITGVTVSYFFKGQVTRFGPGRTEMNVCEKNM